VNTIRNISEMSLPLAAPKIPIKDYQPGSF
jgi:hypothetical protein